MNRVLGICNLHDGPHLGKLTTNRPLGTVTVLGRYGLIDFALSNFSNSEIDKVCILVEDHIEAVRNHVGNGQVWVTNLKTGFQKILFNEKKVSTPKFNTDIDNILENIDVLRDMSVDYIVVTPPFFMMNVDFREMIDQHIASGREISLLYKKVSNADKDFINCDSINFEDGEIKGFGTNVGKNKKENISLETFIINKEKLFEIAQMTKSVSAIYTLRKMIAYLVESNLEKVNAIEFKDHVVPFLSFDGYVKNSMKLLNQKEVAKILHKDWQIYTTVHSTPPTLYGPDAEVKNSYIANGSIVDGKVINSILSRDVIVKKGAVVKDCILFTRTVVGENVKVENIVSDKRAKIRQEKNVKGEKDSYLYIDYGANI